MRTDLAAYLIIGTGGHASVIRDFYSGNGYVIAVGDNRARKRVAENSCYDGMEFGKAVHPSAIVAKSAHIAEGSVIMAGAVVQPGVRIGKHCIVNSGATVDHDCVIEDFAHIAPGAHLCGGVHVGEGALVGVGVGIAPLAKIPAWSLVKARRLEIEPLPTD